MTSYTKKPTTQSIGLMSILLGLTAFMQPSLAADVPKAVIQEYREIKSTDTLYPNENTSYKAVNNTISNQDSLALLIQESEKKYPLDALEIEEHTHIKPLDGYATSGNRGIIVSNLDFDQWLHMSPYRVSEVADYQSYLAQYVGVYNVPPMNQLLSTARSWEECGYDPYQIPPRGIWSNMIQTLKLYSTLKSQGILPQSTVIRSVYRSPELNACAGGAASSKHMTNGAIDIWVPEYEDQPWYINPMQDNLCRFWKDEGHLYEFGLGIYATGSIHLDTQGHRIWGIKHTSADSVCHSIR